MSKFKQSFLTIAIGIALIAGISYAWTGPTTNPPLNNAPAPLNVLGDISGGTQTITGTKTLFMGSGGDKTLGIVGAIWTRGLIQTEGGLWTKGGLRSDGSVNWFSHFPYTDGKNYIRGTTIIADNDEDNRVGIGTNDPQAKLSVSISDVNERSVEATANDIQKIFMVPWLEIEGYNPITSSGDKGIFWTTNDAGNDNSTGALVIAPWGTSGGLKINKNGSLRIADGTQGAGKVLTSDAEGNGSWEPIPPQQTQIQIQTVKGTGGTAYCPTGFVRVGCSGSRQVDLADTCDEDECGYIGTHPIEPNGCLTSIDGAGGTTPVAVAYCLKF